MIKRNCTKCGEPIPQGRIKALPNTRTCTRCSDVYKYSGHLIVHHKTGNEIQLVKDPETAKYLHYLDVTKGR